MPFKSQQQRKYMFSQHPEMAKRWEKESPTKGKKLPKYVKKSEIVSTLRSLRNALQHEVPAMRKLQPLRQLTPLPKYPRTFKPIVPTQHPLPGAGSHWLNHAGTLGGAAAAAGAAAWEASTYGPHLLHLLHLGMEQLSQRPTMSKHSLAKQALVTLLNRTL